MPRANLQATPILAFAIVT